MAHILLPTDFSEASFVAATFAFDLYGVAGNTYTLVHAYLKPPCEHPPLPPIGDSTRREAVNGMRRFERKVRSYAGRVHLAQVVSSQSLTEALNRLHQTKGADIIVMGTRGARDRGLVGQHTSNVVLNAEIPVITVPTHWYPAPISKIMLAIDEHPISGETLAPFTDLAHRVNSKVTVAQVRKGSMWDVKTVDRSAIEKGLNGVEHAFVTAYGTRIAATLDELITGAHVDLLAVVHRQRSFWEELFHISTARSMALHTHVPLLVLRDGS